MSSPTQPFTGPVQPAGPAALADGAGSLADEHGFEPPQRERVIRAGRVQPPAELLAQIADAERVHAELALHGCRVHFAEDELGGLAIELQDLDGRTLRALSPLDAIALACGEASIREL